MRFADFSFFSIWFSVFVKNTSGFSVLVPNVVLVFPIFFPIWTYLGIQFCMRFSVLADFVCGFAVLNEYFFGFAVSSIPQCPPLNRGECYETRDKLFLCCRFSFAFKVLTVHKTQ